jgi:hypothetical protein
MSHPYRWADRERQFDEQRHGRLQRRREGHRWRGWFVSLTNTNGSTQYSGLVYVICAAP